MKMICVSKKVNIEYVCVDGQKVEQVSQYRYLGSLISEDGYCTTIFRAELRWQRKHL